MKLRVAKKVVRALALYSYDTRVRAVRRVMRSNWTWPTPPATAETLKLLGYEVQGAK